MKTFIFIVLAISIGYVLIDTIIEIVKKKKNKNKIGSIDDNKSNE